jgi:hypothetical protein
MAPQLGVAVMIDCTRSRFRILDMIGEGRCLVNMHGDWE